MAEQIISSLVTTFDPTAYNDEYQERVVKELADVLAATDESAAS